MSLYNMMNGTNVELVIKVSTMLNKRIDEIFPRFRDIFTEDGECPFAEDAYDVLVYTRMGGGNRACWEEETTETCACPACQCDRLETEDFVLGSYDDAFDCTYRTFAVILPEDTLSMDEMKERYYKLFKQEEKTEKELNENK